MKEQTLKKGTTVLLATVLFLATLGKFLRISGLHWSGRSPYPPDLFVKRNKQARMKISTLPSSAYSPLGNTATQNEAIPIGPT